MDEIPPQVPGYRLTRLLGRGSTASVWRARRLEDDALVAVKVLPGDADEEAVREYTLLQHAAGEHVVELHEILALDTDEGLGTALILEFLAGGSLERIVAERGHLTPGETVTVIAPIARALGCLHDLGLIHGDLSPANVLLDSTGRPVLADLGFSRLTGEAPADVHGTDGYLAPEVIEGDEPTRAADVHALGALAWCCLVGSPPGHIAARLDLAEAVPDAPALVAAVAACLSGDPQKRPEAGEVARAVFDAVPAQPLRMTCSGDVASGLTRRIREAAAEDGEQIPTWQRELAARASGRRVRRRRWRRDGWARGGSGRRQERPVARPIPAQGGRHGARSRAGAHIAAHPGGRAGHRTRNQAVLQAGRAGAGTTSGRRALVGAGLLGVVVAVAVLIPWHPLATAGGGEPAKVTGTSVATTASATAAPATPTTVAIPTPGPVRADRGAPRRVPIALARELTELRRRAVVDLDTDALRSLVEPGSPAAKREARTIESLRTGGDRYRGVALLVRAAHLQRTRGRSAVLRTTVDEGAYVVLRRDGTSERRAARPGQQVDLVLVWHEQRWRVRDVLAV